MREGPIRFVMSPRGESALGLPAGEYYAVPKERMQEILRRDWDSRVLDAWTEYYPGGRTWHMRPYVAGFVGCVLLDEREPDVCRREFGNANAPPGRAFDDARHAAAMFAFSTLPSAVRKDIGESP